MTLGKYRVSYHDEHQVYRFGVETLEDALFWQAHLILRWDLNAAIERMPADARDAPARAK